MPLKIIYPFLEQKHQNLAQLVRFCFVGLINTAITLVLIWFFMTAGGGVYLANLCGYATGAAFSFTLNKTWTFEQRDPTRWAHVWRFVLACGISYSLNLAMVVVMLMIGAPPYAAQIAGIPVYTISYFIILKYFIFKPSFVFTSESFR